MSVSSGVAAQLQELKAFVMGASPIAKIVSCILVVGYIVGGVFFSEEFAQIFGMVPASTLLQGRMWTPLTAGFLEQHIVTLFFNCAMLLMASQYLDKIWSTRMMIEFIIAVSVGSYFLTMLSCLLLFVFSFYGPIVYTSYSGFAPVIAGLSVVVKQLIPEYQLAFIFVDIRGKFLPFVLFAVAVFFGIVERHFAELPLVCWGIVVAWLFLRYFQRKEDGTVGDRGSSLAFKTLFPQQLHPLVDRIEFAVVRILERLNVITTPGGEFLGEKRQSSESSILPTENPSAGQDSSQSSVNVTVESPAASPELTEEQKRRRELATKALEEFQSRRAK